MLYVVFSFVVDGCHCIGNFVAAVGPAPKVGLNFEIELNKQSVAL
jgi:hypothetical protein